MKSAHRQRDGAFAIRRHDGEKVQIVSCRPDWKSKQLVAFICGELFVISDQKLRFEAAQTEWANQRNKLCDSRGSTR